MRIRVRSPGLIQVAACPERRHLGGGSTIHANRATIRFSMHLPAPAMSPDDAAMTKAEIRREMRLRLPDIGATRTEKSRAICDAIAAHPAFVQGELIALFSPLPGEPDVEGLWEKGGRGFCYPRVSGSELEFVDVHMLADLAPSAWNPAVLEPAFPEARVIPAAEIDLIIVPGLAFTRDGRRLGRGGGFYDRFLARLPTRTTKIGVCFDLQMVGELPTEPHDERLDAVVTESGMVGSLH